MEDYPGRPKTTLLVTSLTPDEIFLAIQPDDQARNDAKVWLRANSDPPAAPADDHRHGIKNP